MNVSFNVVVVVAHCENLLAENTFRSMLKLVSRATTTCMQWTNTCQDGGIPAVFRGPWSVIVDPGVIFMHKNNDEDEGRQDSKVWGRD